MGESGCGEPSGAWDAVRVNQLAKACFTSWVQETSSTFIFNSFLYKMTKSSASLREAGYGVR